VFSGLFTFGATFLPLFRKASLFSLEYALQTRLSVSSTTVEFGPLHSLDARLVFTPVTVFLPSFQRPLLHALLLESRLFSRSKDEGRAKDLPAVGRWAAIGALSFFWACRR